MAHKMIWVALAALVASTGIALADSTIHGFATATTIPIPTLSCIEVDQGPGTDTKLCPGNPAGWAAAFGFGPLATAPSISAALDTIGSTQGGILYRSAVGWSYLAPGTTGQFLETLGPGANPLWAAAGGGGGGLSGMTAGQVPIAATASTVTSSKPLTGTGANVASSSGALINGHCVQINGAGDLVDAGGACTVGGGGGTVTSGTAPQAAYYASTGTTVSGNTNITYQTGFTRLNYMTSLAVAPTPPVGTVLQLLGPDAANTHLQVASFGGVSKYSTACYGGTGVAPTAMGSGLNCGGIDVYAYNGANLVGTLGGFRFNTAEVQSGGHGGMNVFIANTPIGSAVSTDRVEVVNDGSVLVPPTVTGGSQGAGTINAAGLFVNGTPVSTGGVTSVTCGSGLSGGTITTTGTCAMPNTGPGVTSFTNANISLDAQGRITAAANGTPGGTANTSVGTITSTGANTYVMTTPLPSVSANSANYRVCGYIAAGIGNTGTATLAVGTAAAMPVQVTSPTGVPVGLAGGEFTGQIQTQCFQANAPSPTAWIMDGPGSGTTLNPGTHPVTPAEWKGFQVFITSAGSNNLQLPASTTLSPNGGILLVNFGANPTLTPTGGDQINGANAANLTSGDMFTMVTTDSAGHFFVPLPRVPVALTWLPGMNMSAVATGVTMSPAISAPRVIIQAECRIDAVTGIGGTVNADLFYAPDGTAFSAGTPITTTPCNANGTANTTQLARMASPVTVPAGSAIGVVFRNFTSGSVGAGSIQFRY